VAACHGRRSSRPAGPGDLAGYRGPGAGRGQGPPAKIRGWLNRADDPAFWARAGAVCRLYLNPPSGTVLISVDEKTGIQAKSRNHPQIPARPGRDTRREFEYVRQGTISIIAAMNVTTGQAPAVRENGRYGPGG
jgi:DDE superfamily endonuclease